jgi:hypothetical protein
MFRLRPADEVLAFAGMTNRARSRQTQKGSLSMALSMNERALLDWLAIRIAYERGTETLDTIAARWGVSVGHIHTMRRMHGWMARKDRVRGIDTGPPGALTDDIILKERLKRIVTKKLDRIEEEAAKPEGEAKDTGTDAKLAGELLRSYERMDRVATRTRPATAATVPPARAAAAKPRRGAVAAGNDGEADERWCMELAERIERLTKTWTDKKAGASPLDPTKD